MTCDDGPLHRSCSSSTAESKVKEQNYIDCTTRNTTNCATFSGHWILSEQLDQQGCDGHSTHTERAIRNTSRRVTDFRLKGGGRVGRSKTSVDGWCGGRFEKAGDPKEVDGQFWKGYLQQAEDCCGL